MSGINLGASAAYISIKMMYCTLQILNLVPQAIQAGAGVLELVALSRAMCGLLSQIQTRRAEQALQRVSQQTNTGIFMVQKWGHVSLYDMNDKKTEPAPS